MILLQGSEYLIGESSIPDWIQAIGAIIAIIAGIVGFIQLYKDSKEKQTQINVLTDLAKESALQTNHLSAQVDQMIEGNKLQSMYISLFQRTVSTNEESLIIKHEKNELYKQIRKNEIKPNFNLSLLSNDYDIQPDKPLIEKDNIKLGFQNIGEKATLIEYIELEKNSQNIDMSNILNKEYLKNQGFKVDFKWFYLKKQKSDLFIHFKLVFEDEDRNKYYQIFEGTYKGNFVITKPIEIIKPSEN